MNCKTCKNYTGDCGHHHIDSDNHTNFDIPAESATDKYGECYFYKESRDDFQVAWDYLNSLVAVRKFSFHEAESIKNRINEMYSDIKDLIGYWFSTLEDEGCEPCKTEKCVNIANKYEYTKEDYQNYLRTIC